MASQADINVAKILTRTWVELGGLQATVPVQIKGEPSLQPGRAAPNKEAWVTLGPSGLWASHSQGLSCLLMALESCPGQKASGWWAALAGHAVLVDSDGVGEGGQDGGTAKVWPLGGSRKYLKGRGWHLS